ncbi:hypothetical protein RFI_00245 [Reticulomyxa filosa]|uniref:Uncharacterized protein n=1 Tax=Reticulomyxa filosa TaxID=46433 RepID=X6PGK4_RETFI|nr:hypothetical protein RFI_00245 [Reticulomyxa filosa]|eukprot:ETO36817.1 hypothetical protein RFI_00245 [Reticulomyxa filosa]
MFNGHEGYVYVAEYSPFVIKNGIGNSNVICSGSHDNTIRFWDIRSNKKELYLIKGSDEDYGIYCLKFVSLKVNEQKSKDGYCVHLYYGSCSGLINKKKVFDNILHPIDKIEIHINYGDMKLFFLETQTQIFKQLCE